MPFRFRNDDRCFAEAVSRLAYANPFTAERVEWERQALGPVFDERESDWNRLPGAVGESRNVDRIVERALTLAEEAVTCWRELPPRDQELYRDLVFFGSFHGLLEDFSTALERAIERGSGLERMRSYDRFSRQLHHFFGEPMRIPGYAGDDRMPHLYACFFQIRRAFLLIFRYIVGRSEASTRMRARVWQSIFTHDMERYQRALYDRMGDIATLITGPSGTGKELVARAVGMSRFLPFDPTAKAFRGDFVADFHGINLSALSPTLIESELFGHRKGAFTGASADRPGYFEVCGPFGTVFLDEIGEADETIQVKLLRVLQGREFRRLGDTDPRRFEGKVVAATNRDLEREMEQGGFREDLFFRLCADRIETVSLRAILADEPDEIRFLARHIAVRVAGEEEADAIADQVAEYVAGHLPPEYAWPGNFRELEQCVRNLMVHGEYRPVLQTGAAEADRLVGDPSVLPEALLSQHVTRIYAREQNYEAVGRLLDMDRRTVKKYVDEDLLAELGSG